MIVLRNQEFKKYNFDLNKKTCLAISTKAGVDALVGQDKKIVPDVEDPVQAEIVKFENSEEGTSSNVELLEVSGLIEFEGSVAMSNSSTSTLPPKTCFRILICC